MLPKHHKRDRNPGRRKFKPPTFRSSGLKRPFKHHDFCLNPVLVMVSKNSQTNRMQFSSETIAYRQSDASYSAAINEVRSISSTWMTKELIWKIFTDRPMPKWLEDSY
jgi:hypothetical protein